MPTRMALVMVLVAAVAAGPAPAAAGDVRISVGVGAPAPRRQVFVPSGSQVTINAPSRVFVAPPSRITVNAPSRIFVGAPPVCCFPAPVYVYQPRRCVVPGYWAYTWLPQQYTDDVWVESHYDSDALWVAGHFEPRVQTGGYYLPYWVPERATDC
ncbi:MAG TPA: hypothetical protein VKG64_04555 [Methylomirabilota bacterium]|nr:hypothetical protein [Methylomirabilota bacterium]